jgi:hypothetical protein
LLPRPCGRFLPVFAQKLCRALCKITVGAGTDTDFFGVCLAFFFDAGLALFEIEEKLARLLQFLHRFLRHLLGAFAAIGFCLKVIHSMAVILELGAHSVALDLRGFQFFIQRAQECENLELCGALMGGTGFRTRIDGLARGYGLSDCYVRHSQNCRYRSPEKTRGLQLSF